MTPTTADDLLLEVLRKSCVTAGDLASTPGRIPVREISCLRRDILRLTVAKETETDWALLLATLAEVDGFWDCIDGLVLALRIDDDVEAALHFTPDVRERSKALWNHMLGPTLQRLSTRQGGWNWDARVALRLIADWRDHVGRRGTRRFRSIAPLDNVTGQSTTTVALEDGIVIRPFGDDERDRIWREVNSGEAFWYERRSVHELERWTHAIDIPWSLSADKGAFSRDELDKLQPTSTVNDVVRALRLLYPGLAEAPLIWTHPEPYDAPGGRANVVPDVNDLRPSDRARLIGGRAWIKSDDGPALLELLRQLRAVGASDRLALVLRRFDSAYARQEHVDSLIDLWVAFEALLIPSDTSELSYRVSLRIARLIGPDAEARRRAFALARRSYRIRSRIVHGETPPEDLPQLLNDTRELARQVLARWLLKPPPRGVEDLDAEMLA